MSEPMSESQKLQLIEDQHVTAENKLKLLSALVSDGTLSYERAEQYCESQGIPVEQWQNHKPFPGDVLGGSDAIAEEVREQQQRTVAETRVQQHRDDIEAGKNLLSAERFSSSDLIIDAGLPGLRIFDDFYPHYEDAKSAIGAGSYESATTGPVVPEQGGLRGAGGGASYHHTGVDPDSLRAGLDEFRGIEFSAFRADAEMLRTAGKAVDDATDQLDTAWSKNLSDWSGEGAAAAQQRRSHVVKGAGTLSQALRSAPDVITTTVDDYIQRNVSDFSSRVLEMYGDGTMAGLTPKDVHGLLIALRDLPGAIAELNAAIQELNDRNILERAMDWLLEKLSSMWGLVLAGPAFYVGAKLGIHLQELTEDNIVAERDKCQQLLTTSNTKLADFVREYTTRATEVHQQAAEYVAAIQESYGALIESLNADVAEDPFAVTPAGEKAPATGPGVGPTGGGAGGLGGGGGAPSLGGGSPGDGGGSFGGGPGGAGSVEPPAMTPGGADSPLTTNPVTGKPLEVDPEAGKPYPINPETGEAVKDAGPDVDTMIVRAGENQIGITEPDSSGSMAVTVDDGSGVSKQYRLDFSPGEGDSAAGGPGSAAGGFGPAGDGPVPGGGGGAPGTAGVDGAAGVYGAGGAKGVHTPGDDGSIRIEDGELTIVAEQPLGPDGATVVTIGNGEDEPQTYVLGDERAVAECNQRLAEEEILLAESQPGAGSGGSASSGVSSAPPAQDAAAGPAAGAEAAAPAPESATPAAAPDSAPDPVATAPAADGGLGVQPASVGASTVDAGAFGSDADSGPGFFESVFDREGVENGVADAQSDAFQENTGADAKGIGGSSALAGESPMDGGDRPTSGGAGVGVAPGEAPAADPAAASGSGGASGGAMGGMPMMGGMGAGVGSAGGGDEQRSGSAFQVDGGDLFEPDVPEGPFGAARISGSLDDDD